MLAVTLCYISHCTDAFDSRKVGEPLDQTIIPSTCSLQVHPSSSDIIMSNKGIVIKVSSSNHPPAFHTPRAHWFPEQQVAAYLQGGPSWADQQQHW